VTSPVSGI